MKACVSSGRSLLRAWALKPAMALLAALLAVAPASAHHTYAMFDASRTLTVTGPVAKLETISQIEGSANAAVSQREDEDRAVLPTS